MMLNIGKIVVEVEGSVGARSVPFIITEMTFKGEVRDWSTKVGVVSSHFCNMHYLSNMSLVIKAVTYFNFFVIIM